MSHIRQRIRAGELTERNLAHLAGLSQPHLHNALKGARSLSLDYCDRLIKSLNISAPDLIDLSQYEYRRFPSEKTLSMPVPRLRGAAGFKSILDHTTYPGEVYMVERQLAESLKDPAVIILAEDPALGPLFRLGDLALIDRRKVHVATLEATAFYLVETGDGSLVRLLRAGGNRLYLVTPQNGDEPRLWDYLPILGQDFDSVVRGKLVWLARNLHNGLSVVL